jgi:hypothetical protein
VKREFSPEVQFCYCSKTVRLLHAATATAATVIPLLQQNVAVLSLMTQIQNVYVVEVAALYILKLKQGDIDASCCSFQSPELSCANVLRASKVRASAITDLVTLRKRS